jgi:hypothetical protein
MTTRVCLATTMAGFEHARVMDSILSRALDLRGASVEFMLCDKAIPVCQMVKFGRATPEAIANAEPVSYCDRCVERGSTGVRTMGAPVTSLSSYVRDEDRAFAEELARSLPGDDLRTYVWNGFHVGEHAYAGALRYFARGDLHQEPYGEAVLRRYLVAGLLTIISTRRYLSAGRFDVLVINHGIYIPQGMIVEVARSLGIRVVTYNPAYRKTCFVFSHDESYHFSMLSEPRSTWQHLQLTDSLRQSTMSYLRSRRQGVNDWIWFHNSPEEDRRKILSSIGCDPSKPIVVALTSVVWDAQLHYRANAFPSMMDWLACTVSSWASRTDDLQLVIRIHPAEVRGAVPSRQRAVEELARLFPVLPRNVFVVPPDHEASTYALCDAADSVIVYNTKAAVEMSALGIPIIVAGEAWVRGKGFTVDASSPDHYVRELQRLPLRTRLQGGQADDAIRYAYHFFFRRMIPLPFLTISSKGAVDVDFDTIDVSEGRWPGLDTICRGVLTGAPFIYEAESLTDPFPGEV